VVHKFDEASGSLKACIAEPEELEKRQKKQMVNLNFQIFAFFPSSADVLFLHGFVTGVVV